MVQGCDGVPRPIICMAVAEAWIHGVHINAALTNKKTRADSLSHRALHSLSRWGWLAPTIGGYLGYSAKLSAIRSKVIGVMKEESPEGNTQERMKP